MLRVLDRLGRRAATAVDTRAGLAEAVGRRGRGSDDDE